MTSFAARFQLKRLVNVPDSQAEPDVEEPEGADPDEELNPGVRLRPSGAATRSTDPDWRADDESVPDIYRLRRNRS